MKQSIPVQAFVATCGQLTTLDRGFSNKRSNLIG
jgi:hypothetical protein